MTEKGVASSEYVETCLILVWWALLIRDCVRTVLPTSKPPFARKETRLSLTVTSGGSPELETPVTLFISLWENRTPSLPLPHQSPHDLD